MGERIVYYRVSTKDQSIESQRGALGGHFDREFSDVGVSGAVPAAKRPGFAALLEYARSGDTVHVFAIDRLGRDAIDVQQTVRALIEKGVTVDIHGLGTIAKGVGELILAVLAQVASMERARISERTASGRAVARASLDATGLTHKGKVSMGRPVENDPALIRAWRTENSASIAATATHFDVSLATVKRACAGMQKAPAIP